MFSQLIMLLLRSKFACKTDRDLEQEKVKKDKVNMGEKYFHVTILYFFSDIKLKTYSMTLSKFIVTRACTCITCIADSFHPLLGWNGVSVLQR